MKDSLAPLLDTYAPAVDTVRLTIRTDLLDAVAVVGCNAVCPTIRMCLLPELFVDVVGFVCQKIHMGSSFADLEADKMPEAPGQSNHRC